MSLRDVPSFCPAKQSSFTILLTARSPQPAARSRSKVCLTGYVCATLLGTDGPSLTY